MLPIEKMFLTSRRNRPSLRNASWYRIRELKGIVVHWTANESTGANAERTRNYFNTTDRYASAHYNVDDRSIVQCLPDHEVGYHVGGRYYKPTGQKIIEGTDLTPNYFLIGFEMCVNKDGDWNKTYQNSVELAQFLLNKYNFTTNELYRHYDITGKLCPLMMIDEKPWQEFKEKVNRGLNFQLENPIKQGFVNTRDLNVRKGPSSRFPILKVLHQDDKIEIYEQVGNWFRVGPDEWLHKHYVEVTFEKKDGIVVDPTNLNVRSGPGANYPIVGTLKDGTPVEIFDIQGRWYRIGTDRWGFGPLMKIVEVKTGRVIAPSFLNVRKGPGTNNAVVSKVQRGTLVKILAQEGRWLQIGNDEWVFGGYIEVIE